MEGRIAGYTISNDVSERQYQLERGGQWDKGKSCETFNPLGPWLVPADDVSDVQALSLRLWVNGQLRQNSTTADMIFGVNYLVWYVSQFMVLKPGDIINTGTPGGVALALPGQPYLPDRRPCGAGNRSAWASATTVRAGDDQPALKKSLHEPVLRWCHPTGGYLFAKRFSRCADANFKRGHLDRSQLL